MEDNDILTDKEAKFCLLYIDGAAPLAGDARQCYKMAFNCPDMDDAEAMSKAKLLFKKPAVKERIKDLDDFNFNNANALKPRITEVLLSIMSECSMSVYKDRFNKELSPAALRSVAVNAAKILSDMYGIKEEIEHKITLGDGTENGITFNVIMPDKKENEKPESERNDTEQK